MKQKRLIIPAVLILMAMASCELLVTDTYNNDYAGDWYRKTSETSSDFDVLRMEMSDQHFTTSDTTLSKTDFTGDDYQGMKRGNIEKSGSTLTLTVTEVYIDSTERWYSREEYYDYLTDTLHFSSSTASSETNSNFYTRTVSYTVSSSPDSLVMGTTSDGDLFGSFYTTIYDALSY